MDTKTSRPLLETLTVECGLSEREIFAHLTPTLADLARTVGLAPVLKLLDHYQGRKIYIPASAANASGFVSLFGTETAAKIIEHLGGSQKLEVCTPFGERFWNRMAAIRALREGASINEVSRRFGISHTTVKRLRRTFCITPAPTACRNTDHIARPKPIARIKVGSQRAAAFKMFAAGKTVSDICTALNESLPIVRKWQRRYGELT